MKIKVFHTKNYGRVDCYVVETEQAEAIRTITGAKTLTDQAKKGFEMLGFEFVETLQERTY